GRLTTIKDLPSKKVFTGYLKKAKALKDAGVKPKRNKMAPKAPAKPPADLLAALAKNKKAKATFDAFPPSHKRDYVQWIVEAKREETRAQRLKTAIEWMAEGKPRKWKYMK